MTGLFSRRRWLAAGAACALFAAAAPAQETPYRPVPDEKLPLDRAGVFTLNFAYVPPRIASVKVVPREGAPAETRVVWYMVYYVYNKTNKPQTIFPEFELVTKDPDGVLASFLDEPQPAVLDAIRKIEDPTGELKLQSSIGIGKAPVPVTGPDSVPRAVYGVAVWLDVPAKAPTVNNFSVYCSGLSDGLAVKETMDGKVIISKKTLQLDFRRPTDAVRNRANDIGINDNNGLGSERWFYRESKERKAK